MPTGEEIAAEILKRFAATKADVTTCRDTGAPDEVLQYSLGYHDAIGELLEWIEDNKQP